MIARALAGLTLYRQFILYQKVPKVENPARVNKYPCDWRTGKRCSAFDRAAWTDFDTAQTAAQLRGSGYGVGFVLTPEDPFWFIDVDDCRTNSGWTPLATDLMRALPGAAVEVSLSGSGLHVIGSGRCKPHACAPNSSLGLYHEKRFIALGGFNDVVGDVNTELSAEINAVIDRYFPLSSEPSATAIWTTAPASDWSGFLDDDELIAHAMKTRSAASAFGAHASFADLWENRSEALALAYPATDGRTYDNSSADAALASHLAYYTGNDCARVRRIMLKSGLVREKWNRESYLRRTILSACANNKRYSHSIQSEDIKYTEGSRILSIDDQVKLFSGCAYVLDRDCMFVPDGQFLTQSRFNALYGGYSFVMSRDNAAMSKKAFDAFTQNQAVQFPKVATTEFDPLRAPREIWTRDGARILNSYVPIITARSDKDVKPFITHLHKLFPVTSDRLIIENYMAAVVQRIGHKFQWAPLIQGAPGNGKTLLARCLIQAVGLRYAHSPKPAELASRFNDFLLGKLFINVEDIYKGKNTEDILEALAAMITSEYLEIEAKGGDKRTRKICANFMINSNHVDGIRKMRWDRRYAMFYTPHQSYEDILADGMGGQYFPDMYAWLKSGGYAAVTGWLHNYPIRSDLDPAGSLQRAPRTSSTERAIKLSASPPEQEIEAAIEEGRVGFRAGWVSSHFVDLLFREKNYDHRVPRNKRKQIMLDAGYITHPGLPEGRSNSILSPDGCKSTLYVRPDHPSIRAQLHGSAVSLLYSAQQVANDFDSDANNTIQSEQAEHADP